MGRPCGRGLVLHILRAAAGVLHIGGAPYWFQLLGASDLVGRAFVVLRIGTGSWAPACRRSLRRRVHRAGEGLVRNIGETAVWRGVSAEHTRSCTS